MPEAPRIPLARLALAAAAPDGQRVCTDGSDRRQWRTRVQAWREALAPLTAPAVALHHEDGFEFSAALFGAWLAGKEVWLPGDLLPATLAGLDAAAVARIGQWPGAQALAAGAGGGAEVDASLDPRAARLVLFTSGSTGEPTPVRKHLEQLEAEVAALEACFGPALGAAQVHGTVSHQHIYGLLFRLLWPLSSGRPFARRRLEYNEELVPLGESPLVLVASPAHLKRLPDTQDWRRLAGNLRRVFSSGGPLPADAAREVERLWGQAPVEVLGSTETGGIAHRAGGGPATAWTALPGVQWRIEDGQLAIRSPHLGHGDWWRSPDRAEAGPDGGFLLRGRADRILKIEERRISLDAVAAALGDTPWLQELRVVPLPGPRTLLAAAATLTPAGAAILQSQGRAGLVQRLREACGGRLDPVAWPRRWRFVDALPMDAQGKTSQRRLAELFRPHLPPVTWIERGPAQARLTLVASADVAGFEGHFPGRPILPGVVLLDWVRRLGREAFGLEGPVRRMDTIKFQHLVRPGHALDIALARSPGTLEFRVQGAAGVHASGKLHFGGRSDG